MSVSFRYYRAPVAAWLEVTDEDAADFLQSQFSNDLQAGIGQATYGLWLDHRGKIHGDGTILQVEAERFYLHGSATDSEMLREKLESHIVADDVMLTDRSPEVASVIVWGSGLEKALEGTHLMLPNVGRFAASETLWLFAARAAPKGAWQIVGSPSSVDELIEKLAAGGGGEALDEAFHFARIEAGNPLVPTEVGPGETPIEAGLESACSWTKGCFLGQEVVARQHRLERRSNVLTVVRVEGDVGETPATLHVDQSKVGSLRCVARQGERQLGLAMLKARVGKMPNDLEISVEGGEAKVFVASGNR